MSASTDRGPTVLYVPNLVPPDAWLKKALFHSDRVSTMYSSQIVEIPERLRQLDGLGFWAPANVDELDASSLNEVSDEAIAVAEQHITATVPEQLTVQDKVLAGKLPEFLEGHLLKSGHLTRLDDDNSRLGSWSKQLVPTMLTLCAARIANDRDWRLDVRSAHVLQAAVSPLAAEASPGRAATLTGLPDVGAKVSLDDVLAFRLSHESEFADYRYYLSKVEASALSEGNSVDDALREVRKATKALQRAAERKGMPWTERSRTWVGQLRSPQASLTAAAASATFASHAAGMDTTTGALAAVALALGLTAKAIEVRPRLRAVAYMSKAQSQGLLPR